MNFEHCHWKQAAAVEDYCHRICYHHFHSIRHRLPCQNRSHSHIVSRQYPLLLVKVSLQRRQHLCGNIFSSFLAKQQTHSNFDDFLAESADSQQKTREEVGSDWPIMLPWIPHKNLKGRFSSLLGYSTWRQRPQNRPISFKGLNGHSTNITVHCTVGQSFAVTKIIFLSNNL